MFLKIPSIDHILSGVGDIPVKFYHDIAGY